MTAPRRCTSPLSSPAGSHSCRPKAASRPAPAPRAPAEHNASGVTSFAGSLVASDAGQTGRLDDEKHQHERKPDSKSVLRADQLARHAFDQAQHQATDEGPGHAAQPADNADDKCLAEKGI